jgi:hypothetical protein
MSPGGEKLNGFFMTVKMLTIRAAFVRFEASIPAHLTEWIQTV